MRRGKRPRKCLYVFMSLQGSAPNESKPTEEAAPVGDVMRMSHFQTCNAAAPAQLRACTLGIVMQKGYNPSELNFDDARRPRPCCEAAFNIDRQKACQTRVKRLARPSGNQDGVEVRP